MSTFTTTLLQNGNNVGIEITDEVVAELGGKRVPVVITINGGYTYRNTTAVMGGKDKLAYSHRKEHARAITEAKAEQTRERRVAKAIAMLRGE